MADPQLVTQEEMALRRRARRRLVGAVAIALAAVVVLPMLFDSEPKPLGPDVDLNIPSKDSPFETGAALPPAAPEPPPQAAEPTLPPVSPSALPSGAGAGVPGPAPEASASIQAKPVQTETPPGPEAKPKVEAKAEQKTEARPAAKIDTKADPKPDPKPVAKTESKPAAKPEPVQGNKGYILQLGAFGSEANARLLLDKAQAAGFKAGVSSANGQYRVRVGPIPDHDKALETQNRLKAKGFSPVLMGP